MTKNTKFVLGPVVGICTAAAAGMLAAPKSGEDTRQIIKSRSATQSATLKRRARELIHRRRTAD